jgi:hypothetical protein
MEVAAAGDTVSAEDVKARFAGASGPQVAEPLRIEVPTAGVRYTFKKLYANRAEEPAHFAMSYASSGGATVAIVVSLIGTILFWLGLALVWLGLASRRVATSVLVAGAALVLLATGYFGASVAGPLLLTLLVPVAALIGWIVRRRRAVPPAPPPAV